MKKFPVKADIRTKLAVVICLSTIGVFIQHAYVLAGGLILTFLCAFLFGADLIKALKATRGLWYLFFVIMVLQSIFLHRGTALLSVGNFSILTTGGILKGTEFLLRVSIIVISAAIITTSNYREVIQGLVQLRIPYDIAFMVSVAIRFLPLLRSEVRDTLTAIQLRGVELNKIPFRKRLRVYTYIFMPVLTGAVRKAQALSIAMETRAFRAYPSRTSFLVLRFSARDYVIITLSFITAAAVLIIYYVFKFPGRII